MWQSLRMKNHKLPGNVRQMTVDWLNNALHSESSGVVLDSNIASFSFEPLGEGKGFMNEVVRLTLQTSRGLPSSHLSMVAKFPSQNPEIQALNERVGADRRETMFYQEIAGVTDIPTPDLYFADVDETTGNSVLIIEDLAEARIGDSVKGCSMDDVALAIRSLADFQGNWWNNLDGSRYAWLPTKSSDSDVYEQEYAQAWGLLREKSEGAMPDRLWELGQNLGQHISTIRGHLSGIPATLVHGDYRPDNCFFGDHQDRRPLTVFDWEYCTEGSGVYDVATFLCEALTREQRSKHELDFLGLYHSLLMDKGVTGYSFDQCLLDYRWSYLDLMLFWAVIGAPCDWTGTRAKQYLRNTIERIDGAVHDLDCMKLLF